MDVLDKSPQVSRRGLLRFGGGSLVAVTVLPGGLLVGARNAWAETAKALKPRTFATLVQVSRDTYPHDQLADRFYVQAVGGFDGEAAQSAQTKALFEDGVAGLNSAAQQAHGVPYGEVGWESDRVALLREIQDSPFFQKVRASLVTGIYNNPQAWPMFGYEGESASRGGYIARGFDDIDWLDKV